MIFSLNKFKNIIFDLGGVIINIDLPLTMTAFEELGIKDVPKLFSTTLQQQLFDFQEKGTITSAQFRDEIRKFSTVHLLDSQIDEAWNALLLDLPKARLELLEKVKRSHRTFLLSNTNEIHIQTIQHYLNKEYGISDLSSFFEKTYLSYQLGMRKPDAELFKLVLDENKLNPSETLFIDDTKQHILAAEKLGIQTYWLDLSKENLLDLFE